MLAETQQILYFSRDVSSQNGLSMDRFIKRFAYHPNTLQQAALLQEDGLQDHAFQARVTLVNNRVVQITFNPIASGMWVGRESFHEITGEEVYVGVFREILYFMRDYLPQINTQDVFSYEEALQVLASENIAVFVSETVEEFMTPLRGRD